MSVIPLDTDVNRFFKNGFRGQTAAIQPRKEGEAPNLF